MKHIFKQDNEKMSIGKRTITLYDNITEVQTENGIQYECDMHTVKNVGVFDYDVLLAQEKSRIADEVKKAEKLKAQAFLDSTDYICTKCFERGLNVMAEYPEICAKREAARGVIRGIA